MYVLTLSEQQNYVYVILTYASVATVSLSVFVFRILVSPLYNKVHITTLVWDMMIAQSSDLALYAM